MVMAPAKINLTLEVLGRRADDADVVVTGQCLLKHGDHARVDLDRGDRPRTLGEGRGQDARPGPDLEHLVARPDLGRLDDRGEHRTIDEETLAQRGRGADTVTAERIAQPTRIRDIHWLLRLAAHLHDQRFAEPRANIHAATFAEATGSNGLAPPYPALKLFDAQVRGMNWKSPEAPDAL